MSDEKKEKDINVCCMDPETANKEQREIAVKVLSSYMNDKKDA